jgi:adenosylmethionine-8-amino-7-oxononanoate aminotransferase
MRSWTERDAAVLWHGFTQMATFADNEPIVVDRAEGRELIAIDGTRYLDAISSLWVNTLGHRVPELDAALHDQIGKVAHSTLLGNGNRTTIEFAEALRPHLPVEQPHILFASDGAAAVEQALKIAFQYWTNQGVRDRTAYLTLGQAYHGDTIGSISLGAGGFGTNVFDPLRFPVLRTPGYDVDDWADKAVAAIEANADRLAAVVLEPLVQGAAGILETDPPSVGRVAAACRAADVLFVADEVATGFGRTGTLFASEQCGVTPDLLCLGKGITGGYLALAATVASQRVYDAFLGPDLGERTFYHGHSYSGNALACAVAHAHLDAFAARDVLGNVAVRAEELRALLVAVGARPSVRAVRQRGLMVGVELASPSSDARWGRRVCAAAVRRGVLLRPLGDVVVLMPILTSTQDEIERIVATLAAAIDEVTGA